jgi:ATP-binding cassette, subfamily B, bacterial MsbA
MKNFKFFIKYLKPYKGKITLSMIYVVISTIFSLFSITMIIPFLGLLFNTQKLVTSSVPFTLSSHSLVTNFNYFLSTIIIEQGKLMALVFVCTAIVVMFLFKNITFFLSQSYLAPVRNGIVQDMRQALYDKILEMPVHYFSKQRKGDIMSKMNNDVSEIEYSIIRSLDLLFRSPINLIFFYIALIYISPLLTLFVTVLLPVSALFVGYIGSKLKSQSLDGQQKLGSLMSLIEETLGGIRVIKAFSAEKMVNDKFKETGLSYTRTMNSVTRRQMLASPLSEFLSIVSLAVIMGFGGYMVLANKGLSSESFVGYILVFTQILAPAKALSSAYYYVLKGLASIERVESILQAPNTITDKAEAKRITSFEHSIEYKIKVFKYNEDPILQDISLTIEKGKTIAIVGQSGSGKTTLVDLLPRFYDVNDGDILIDGIPVRDLKIDDLRALIGYVNQEPILFNDSIAANIAFGMKVSNQSDIVEAARVANAEEFIIQRPGTYENNVGDRGSQLSGGQRQRISIARAVMKNPPILILDEATSALDTESERLVQTALSNLMKNRTSIIIAHRLSTIVHADEIIVMNQGRIVERGKHAELLALDGYYKKLHDMQMFK